MPDVKLFRLTGSSVVPVDVLPVTVEKSLQTLIEANSGPLLGVRFLESEHSTGKSYAGRIDTLGLDEDGSPVIIEYKRSLNENVINQGLFYLDWLMDHRGEFELLVLKTLGEGAAKSIDWINPRLICIAGDFTKYDEHAVKQITRNISLVRYRRFAPDLLMFELATAVQAPNASVDPKPKNPGAEKTVVDALSMASVDLQDWYESIKAFVLALGDDVQPKVLKYYFAFRRLRNFACVEIHPQAHKLTVFLNLHPSELALEAGFTRDVSKIGHYGTGDLEVTINSPQDVERAKPLVVESYEAS